MRFEKKNNALPGNEDSLRATNGDGAADDDDKLSFDLVFSLLLFCDRTILNWNLIKNFYSPNFDCIAIEVRFTGLYTFNR